MLGQTVVIAGVTGFVLGLGILIRLEKKHRKRRRQARKITAAILRIEDAMRAEFRPVLDDLERQARVKLIHGDRHSWDVRSQNQSELRP
jgi:Ser/Thr protein kinase RdoA (MazF antagonist)